MSAAGGTGPTMYRKRVEPMEPQHTPFTLPGDGVGCVYILGRADGGVVRVGYSSRLDLSRPAEHGRDGYTTYLALVRGTRADEQALHRYFRKHYDTEHPGHSRESYHKATPGLMAYLVWLRDQYWVAPSAEAWLAAVPDALDSALWLPDEHRQSSRRPVEDLLSLAEVDPWARALPVRQVSYSDYFTPANIIEPVRHLFGGVIDLDPCSESAANRMVKATKYITAAQDGLHQQWGGRIWLNPSLDTWPQFAAKAAAQIGDGNVREMCAWPSLPSLSADYMLPLNRIASALCLINKRPQCWGVTHATNPAAGRAMLYFGPRLSEFCRHLAPLGPCFITGHGL